MTKSDRQFQGISQSLDDFITAFLEGNLTSNYKGTYTTHIDSIKAQNKRLDQRIEDLERYLEQREQTLRRDSCAWKKCNQNLILNFKPCKVHLRVSDEIFHSNTNTSYIYFFIM